MTVVRACVHICNEVMMNYTETQYCVYAVRICQYSVCSLVMSFLYVCMCEDDF